MRLGMRRLSPGVLAALATLAVVLRIGVLLNRRIDPDESQHLHVAWLITQGQVPYRDFWEHHLPFFHYAMAPLTLWLAERPSVYFAARCVMVVLAAVAVVADMAPRAAAVGRRGRVGGGDPRVSPPVRGDVDGDAARRARARGPSGQPARPCTLARGRPDGVALGGRGVAGRGARPVDQGRLRPRWNSRRRGGPAAARASGPGRVGALVGFVAAMALVLGALLAGLVLFTGTDTIPGFYRDVRAGLAALRRLRKDLAGLRKRDRSVPGRRARASARSSREGARHPGAPRARRAAPADLRELLVLFLPRTPAVYQHAWLPCFR